MPRLSQKITSKLFVLAFFAFQSTHAATLLIDLESNQTILEEAPAAPVSAEPMLPLMAVYTALDIAKETAVDLFENVPNPWGDAVKTRKDTVESSQTVELASFRSH